MPVVSAFLTAVSTPRVVPGQVIAHFAYRPGCNAEIDSPLEGDGFEPSVPHTKQPFSLPRWSRNSPSATKIGSFVAGTDGSNPFPSSEKSAANLNSPIVAPLALTNVQSASLFLNRHRGHITREGRFQDGHLPNVAIGFKTKQFNTPRAST